MSDDDSNDVVMVENTDVTSKPGEGTTADTETRPIMQLFQRLTSNDNKQNTVLTNAQIIAILHKEFDIDITTLHELEVDIYLNIVKRFLKDWPKWDEFDRGINTLRKKNAYKSIKKTLEQKYIDLKEYLKIQLDMTKPLAQEAVSKMVTENSKRMEKVDTSEITLEVYCTRKQLNELVLSHPMPGDAESHVFNLTEFMPSNIIVNNLPIEAILNWTSIHVTIDLRTFVYHRSTNHQLKHVLVNSKNGPRDVKRELCPEIQIKDTKRKPEGNWSLPKDNIVKCFEKLVGMVKTKQVAILQPLMNLVINDFHALQSIKVPATYRQYSNKYTYYRKLRKEVENNTTMYDLYVEETLAPMHIFKIVKAMWQCHLKSTLFDNPMWFTVECVECKVKFKGEEMSAQLREHFDVFHSNEPDWICSNCDKAFSMMELARNKWLHLCT